MELATFLDQTQQYTHNEHEIVQKLKLIYEINAIK